MVSKRIMLLALVGTLISGTCLIMVYAQSDWGYDPYTGEPLTGINLTDGERLILSQIQGITTLVYGAIGAALVSALASIVSLMQISRRISG